MFEEILVAHYVKRVLLILLISLPPFIALASKMKKKKTKKQKKVLVIGLVIYIILTGFTNNIFPTILAALYIAYIWNNKKKSEEAYYFRPLKKKVYTFKFKGNTTTATVAKDRIVVILQSLIFKILVSVATLWYMLLLPIIGVDVEDQIILGEFLNASLLKSIYLIILMVVTAPILEEFIFRHLFYRLLKKKIGKILSAIFTGIVFTIFHYNAAGVVMFFSLSIFNSYLYEKYGYRAAVLNHVIFNLLSLIFILCMKSVI